MIFLLSLYVLRLSLLATANGINICNGINLCGTRKPTEDELNEARKVVKEWSESVSQTTTSNQPTITINTVWHRITSGNQGNSENDITNSMVVLNNAFAPHFKFNLIKKTVSTEPHFWDPPSFSDGGMRMHLHEGDCSTLNIYSTKATAAGYAEFPSRCAYQERMDGVIISYDTVPGGADRIWNKGYTLVHEVGHWMNLFHTFENGCSGIGDAIMDTPASRLNRGCPQGKDSCPSEGIDLINNFMDYTDDSCRTSFTSGQFTAMKAAWYKYRYSGPTRPTTLPTNAPSVIGATNEPTRLYTGKRFSSLSELKVQAMAYCASPDTYDTSIYGAIEEWDVSQMTRMDGVFYGGTKHECNPDIGKWDVSRVNYFNEMFMKTTFNQDISAWDVSNGKGFSDMFDNTAFNQDISSWNVSKGVYFSHMFSISPFNQDISSWDVSNSLDFDGMFDSSLFNQDISVWDVSTGLYFTFMFNNNNHFNQDISSWDVQNGRRFDYMFCKAGSFNQNISSWDLSGGTRFREMFQSAKAFNQNLDSWLKWLDKDGNDSTNWCDGGATCDANTALFPTTTPSIFPSINVSQSPTFNKCIGLDKESCLNEEDICKYGNKKKILGDCQYKKKIYKHDCSQYTSSELCLSGFYPGMCTWNDNICSHVCDGLSQKPCKSKRVFFQKICTLPKINNPCFGCHSNSEC